MSFRKMVFSLFKMSKDFARVGYDKKQITEAENKWRIYDGLEVVFDIDSNNGHIKGTEVAVNRRWCEGDYS